MVTGKSDRIHRAFYSQAVADGMGELFEFQSPSLKEVQDFIKSDRRIHFTDDTQMALFGQEAVNLSQSLDDLPREIESAYLRWYDTQIDSCSFHKGVAAMKSMQVQRGPGHRCLASLEDLKASRISDASQGKGCGPVMRLLPFAGLYFDHDAAQVESIAEASCIVTHTHPDAIQATARYMRVAKFLIDGGSREELGQRGDHIWIHGLGWLANECVEMAIWAVQNARDYTHLLELSITHGGDSDSVAAVAGSLWGLAGLGGFETYLPRLAEREVIDSLFHTPR